MTIAASLRQSTPLRADLLAATVALAQIAGRSPQLDQSSSINKAALHYIHLLSPRRSSKQPAALTARHCDSLAPPFKSP